MLILREPFASLWRDKDPFEVVTRETTPVRQICLEMFVIINFLNDFFTTALTEIMNNFDATFWVLRVGIASAVEAFPNGSTLSLSFNMTD